MPQVLVITRWAQRTAVQALMPPSGGGPGSHEDFLVDWRVKTRDSVREMTPSLLGGSCGDCASRHGWAESLLIFSDSIEVLSLVSVNFSLPFVCGGSVEVCFSRSIPRFLCLGGYGGSILLMHLLLLLLFSPPF